jgi:GTP-binding protein Era
MCGHDLAIVAPTPQTTRSRIRGIATRDGGQLLLIDTPGFQDSTRPFDARLQALTTATLQEVDVVLAVIDPTRAGGPEENAIVALARSFHGPVVVALSKADLAPASGREDGTTVPDDLAGAPVHRISAATGAGVEELVGRLIAASPVGPPMYPDDRYTDQPQALRVSEVIRGHAIRATREELPHAMYVEVADLETSADRVWVRAFLNVERESQKGIVIGQRGSLIAAIRTGAQAELTGVLGLPVRLDLRVKVQRNWRRDRALLERLIR